MECKTSMRDPKLPSWKHGYEFHSGNSKDIGKKFSGGPMMTSPLYYEKYW